MTRRIEKTADLESLISNGESTRLEFKQTMQWDTKLHKRNPELLRACVKAVCAFLNGDGMDSADWCRQLGESLRTGR